MTSTASESVQNRRELTCRRLIAASMRRWWRISVAVTLGVATATAVITGALLVGDSMRGSLTGLTLESLGRTEAMVAPMGFFHAAGKTGGEGLAVPLFFFPAGIAEAKTKPESRDGETEFLSLRRAGSVQILGIDDDFWELDSRGIRPSQFPDKNGVVLNASAAKELGVKRGDLITVRLPAQQAVPADSPLGRRDRSTEGLPRMEVLDVIADRGLGRFSLAPRQAPPMNIYVSRQVIGEVFGRQGQANLLLFDHQVNTDDLKVGLSDLGLSLRRITRKFDQQTLYDYFTLTSDRLLLPETVVDQVTTALNGDHAGDHPVVPLTTYLANAIERLDDDGKVAATVSYSTITAIDSVTPSSSYDLPLRYQIPESRLSLRESSEENLVPLVINSWTADQLTAPVGTRLRVAYYEPEVENGKEIERTFNAIVTEVVPLTRPDQPYRRRRDAVFTQAPTLFNDPDLTPLVPGVTDQESIGDWDLPFPLQREISKADDAYWNHHRLTPKAFLPLADGHRLFGSRFGKTTSLRIDVSVAADRETLQAIIEERLRPHLADLGWSVIPIRHQQLAASRGTTPFDGLFLALSSFVIAAAVLLIAMLFRLGLTERTRELGTLMAVGWMPGRVVRMTLAEGLILASIGSLIGVLGGVFYAMGVLAALRTVWVGAVTVPFLTFHWTGTSLVLGAVGGWITAALTLVLTTRWLLHTSTTELLSGRDVDAGSVLSRHAGSSQQSRRNRSRLPTIAGGIAMLALMAGWGGAVSGGQAAAGGFVGGGMLMLFAVLLRVYHRLRYPLQSAAKTPTHSIIGLAVANASRRPLRSTLTIGLMATASFLIIAISAFRLQPSDRGSGGFELIANSAQPLYHDLRSPQVRRESFGPAADDLSSATFAPMRIWRGQDASCNNLYQATRPTVLGVPDDFASDFADAIQQDGLILGFDWISHVSLPSGESPWQLLHQPATGTLADPIPVVIDQNTAMWSLQMMGGLGQVKAFEYEPDRPIHFRVVGLLSNSILQGKLMVGETNFENVFPEVSGYGFFLVDAPLSDLTKVTETLESRLSDIGMDVSNANNVLSGMLAVQNTYLRTFQSLGALGLLLGTIGLAVAQVRSVMERRQELAVLRAIGFTVRRLVTLVMTETLFLLVLGIGCGVLCAALAVLPHAWFAGFRPPIAEPLMVVLAIFVFGGCAGLIATRRVSRLPLIESLRSE